MANQFQPHLQNSIEDKEKPTDQTEEIKRPLLFSEKWSKSMNILLIAAIIILCIAGILAAVFGIQMILRITEGIGNQGELFHHFFTKLYNDVGYIGTAKGSSALVQLLALAVVVIVVIKAIKKK